MMADQTITVLVQFKNRSRPVRIIPGETKHMIRQAYSDILGEDQTFFVQIKDEQWGGEFVDLSAEQDIPNRSVLRLVLEECSPTALNEPSHCSSVDSKEGNSDKHSIEHSTESSTPSSTPSSHILPLEPIQSKLSTSGGSLSLSIPMDPVQNQKNQLGQDYIMSKAKIYGQNSTRKINPYQEQINKAAVELALEDPNILTSRQQLLKLAREKVNETYNFKKGKSRSKAYASEADSEGSTASLPATKRVKSNEAMRAKHIRDLEEDIRDINDRLKYKEKIRDSANLSRNYKLCDQVTEEMSTLKTKRRECETELAIWKRKQQQSKWYEKKRKASALVSESESGNELISSRSTSHSKSIMTSTSSYSSSVAGSPSMSAQRSPDSPLDSESSGVLDESSSVLTLPLAESILEPVATPTINISDNESDDVEGSIGSGMDELESDVFSSPSQQQQHFQ